MPTFAEQVCNQRAVSVAVRGLTKQAKVRISRLVKIGG